MTAKRKTKNKPAMTTEDSSQRSPSTCRSLLANIPLGVFRTTGEGRFLVVNTALVEMLGYSSHEELVDVSAWDLVCDPVLREELLARVQKQGSARNLIAEIHRKDGSSIWVSASMRAFFSEDGTVAHFDGAVEDISERVSEEEALRDSEVRFRKIFENATIGIFRTTVDGSLVVANQALVRMLGYDDFEEMAKLDMAGEYPPGYTRDTFRELIDRDGVVIGLESAWTTKDRASIRVRVSARAIRSESGETMYYEGTVEDATERWEAVEGLRASELLYRELVEKADIGIVSRGQDGRLTYFNETFCRLFGYEEEEARSLRVIDLVHPDDREGIELRHQLRMSGEPVPNHYEFKGVRKDGSIVDLEIDVSLIKKGNETVGSRSYLWDISARKRSEIALRNSERLSRAVIEHSPIGISIRDRHGRLLVYNHAWREIWQVDDETLQDFLSRPRRRLEFDAHDHYLSGYHEEVARVYREGGHIEIPEARASKMINGQLLWVTQHFYALKSPEGEVDRVVILTEDITSRKESELMLARMREDLEQRVEFRTKQLAEANRSLSEERESLRQKNTTLHELLNQIEQAKTQTAAQVQDNLDRIAMPILDNLENRCGAEERTYVRLLRNCLIEVSSPFANRVTRLLSHLTPRELEICNMVRNGLTSKEIAAAFHTSEQTVLTQRKGIRKKLGISTKKINLTSFLQQLTASDE